MYEQHDVKRNVLSCRDNFVTPRAWGGSDCHVQNSDSMVSRRLLLLLLRRTGQGNLTLQQIAKVEVALVNALTRPGEMPDLDLASLRSSNDFSLASRAEGPGVYRDKISLPGAEAKSVLDAAKDAIAARCIV